jgi:hypothetical protein
MLIFVLSIVVLIKFSKKSINIYTHLFKKQKKFDHDKKRLENGGTTPNHNQE